MKFRHKIVIALACIAAFFIVIFLFYPRAASLLFSYKKECKVLRVEAFMKGVILTGPGQVNKFSVICEDGFICRASDTGFAAVKTGDSIEFRGFPEFGTLEEFGKCDNAQLKKIIPAP